MGSNDYDREKPPHPVNISDFYIGKYPITQAQWEAVMKSKPWEKSSNKFWGKNKPVINVSWRDAMIPIYLSFRQPEIDFF
jgi:formylglycine-generating enzyme required for sulfatase activity